ncbi:MAG: peptide deformylase [Oscillospiraceae bacterium]|nr:peptide deformylase [Oscillospiraceae bacterium]
MALRYIKKEGDPILTKKSRPIENFDAKLVQLIEDMAETMRDANGVGLAGPQVGILRQVAVVDTGDGLIELINPEIINQSGEQQEMEGCLSCPGVYGITVRPMAIEVKAKNRQGNEIILKAEGFKARAICHEIDHLTGILFRKRIIKMLN